MEEKFQQKSLSAEDLAAKLSNSSPLQASRVLIDAELFEQKSSLEVLDEIYSHFESKDSLLEELVKPVGFNVINGIVSHKKLNLTKVGITPERVWDEIKGFDYSSGSVSTDALVDKQQSDELLSDFRNPKEYNRSASEDGRAMDKYKEDYFKGNKTAYSEVEIKGGKRTRLYKNGAAAGEGKKHLVANTDHTVSLKELNDRYSQNVLLKDGDLKVVANSEGNFTIISARVNKSKSDKSYGDRKKQKDSGEKPGAVYSSINDETYDKGRKKEAEARESIRESLSDKALENLKSLDGEVLGNVAMPSLNQAGYQVLGTAIIETIKPIFFELSDSMRNGFENGVGVSDFSEAIKKRFCRIMEYLRKSIIPTLTGAVKDFFQNISKILIEGVLGLVKGIFKSILKVVSEGFSAIISSVKIICTSSEEMTTAQKGDAIVKLLASTISTFVVFYFSESITKLVPDPFDEIMVAIASGVASTVVVYLIDKIDLFSVKYEKRSQLVAEIFQERIATIKKNTDAFNAASVQALAEQKIAFKQLYQDLEAGIDNDFDVTSNVNSIADFMKVDLKIRDTESFLDLLQREKVLAI